jgi:single-strand DNA-binding protein
MNRAIIVGRLGRDPEVKTTASGLTIATLAVATDDREKKGTDWVKVTDWHQVVVFGQPAEFIAEFGRKGASVAVEGRMKMEKYVGKDGIEKLAFKILADRVELVGSREGADRSESSRSVARPAAAPPSRQAGGDDVYDFSADVPF